MREGVFIIPPTPESLLAKTFKKICTEELKGTNISMAVTERGGRTLAPCAEIDNNIVPVTGARQFMSNY